MDKRKAILLDRDGTLNRDHGYVHKVEHFELLPGVIEGLKKLKDEYIFFIITNQSGIGKGYYEFSDFWKFNNRLTDTLKEHGITIEKTYVCPHIKEDNCECHKPKPKFINEIRSEFEIDFANSWMLGDHPSDISFGMNAGCKTVYLLTGHGEKHLNELEDDEIKPDLIANNFLEATNHIVTHSSDET
jgi:histidinol-phosphate phosphatase family protein